MGKTADEDFDPTRVLDGWQPPRAPAEVDLGVIFGATRRAALDAGQLERLRRRGFAMADLEDVEDVPLAPPDFVDTVGLEEHERGLSQFDDPPETLPPAAPAAPSRRLGHWKPGCWVVALRCVQPAGTVVRKSLRGPRVHELGAQWLVAAWPPQRLDKPLLSRWPQALGLVAAADADAAVDALLPALPAAAKVWPAELDVDWGLLAEIALQRDPGLAAWQLKALQAVVDAAAVERESRFASGYACTDGVITRR